MGSLHFLCALLFLVAASSAKKTADPSISTDIDCNTLNYAGETKINALTFGDFSSNSDVQGRLVVCGDAKLDTYSAGQFLGWQHEHDDNIIVGGSLQFSSGVMSGNTKVCGKAIIGTSVENAMINIEEVEEGVCDRYDCKASFDHFDITNLALCTLKPSGHVKLTLDNELEFYGSGTESVEIFNITADQVNSATHMVKRSGSHVTMINVYPGEINHENVHFGGGFQMGSAGRVLINVCTGIKTISLDGISLQASILAPHSDINAKGGVVTGQVIANSYRGPAQLNLAEFDICYEEDTSIDDEEVQEEAEEPDADLSFVDIAKFFVQNGKAPDGVNLMEMGSKKVAKSQSEITLNKIHFDDADGADDDGFQDYVNQILNKAHAKKVQSHHKKHHSSSLRRKTTHKHFTPHEKDVIHEVVHEAMQAEKPRLHRQHKSKSETPEVAVAAKLARKVAVKAVAPAIDPEKVELKIVKKQLASEMSNLADEADELMKIMKEEQDTQKEF